MTTRGIPLPPVWNPPVPRPPDVPFREPDWDFLDDLLRGTSERPPSHLWAKWRGEVLAAEPWCRRCSRPATDVDHILPLEDGGTNRRKNLQPLCYECHRWKTMWENVFRSASNRADKSSS